MHKCSTCKKMFAAQNELNIHQMTSHAKDPLLPLMKCHFCDKIFTKETALRSHLQMHLAGMTNLLTAKPDHHHPSTSRPLPDFRVSTLLNRDDDASTHRCLLCGVSFKEGTLLRLHVLFGLCVNRQATQIQ